MTPQQINDKIAHHRAEVARLEDLQKAARPALAAGQVWRSPEGTAIIAEVVGKPDYLVSVRIDDWTAYLHEHASKRPILPQFEFVGLARDVLRVVQPDAVEQVAPVQDEPTGAELVGKMCWVRVFNVESLDDGAWRGPVEIERFWGTGDGHDYRTDDSLGDHSGWYREAKLYREGVTP